MSFTICFEVSDPFQVKPGYAKSNSMYRVWWGYFAITILRIRFDKFSATKYLWMEREGKLE